MKCFFKWSPFKYQNSFYLMKIKMLLENFFEPIVPLPQLLEPKVKILTQFVILRRNASRKYDLNRK